MNHSKWKNIISWIDQHLADSRLDSETLLRKRWTWIWMMVNLVGVSLMTTLGVIYELKPILWFGYALVLIHVISIPILSKSKRFDLVLNSCYMLIILLAFAVMLQTGGLTTSLGFVFIGLNCAMGSVLAGNLYWTISMFILYCLSIISIGLLEPSLVTPDYITSQVNTIFFVLDAVWVNAGILGLVILFMKDKSQFEKEKAEKLRKLDQAKTQLYTNVSHEFRTPLTIISGMADQIQQNSKKWLQKGPANIKTQSKILLRLVDQMLDISKIEAKSMPLNLVHGDIKKFVKNIVDPFRSLVDCKHIEFEVNINDEPLFTDYDPEKLTNILGNLLSNAIKFTPTGGNISVNLSEMAQADSNIVSIVVRDSGQGIPQESFKHIFERFYQVNDSDCETPGTGLGLAITQELVRLMKGTISFKSEVGEGTAFRVDLPVRCNARKEKDHGISAIHKDSFSSMFPVGKNETGQIDKTTLSLSKPLLLLVEDNKDVVEYLISILEADYIIEYAANGVKGFQKAKVIVPDIILTDIMMPQMDGFEFIQHLKDDILTNHIPVILLTAKGDYHSKLKGLKLGANHYIIKPFQEKELLLKLKNLLESRRIMQEKLATTKLPAPKGKSRYKRELLFMSKINKLIDKQLENEDFGVKDICLNLHMSRPQLYRKFAAIANSSIGKHIKSYRLCKAKEMIENQHKNVIEAARDSGFRSVSHFSTSFKEEFGYSPSELL